MPKHSAMLMVVLCCYAVAGTALDLDEASHLLVRTGFAPTQAEVDVLLPLSREEAVNKLISEATAAITSVTPPSFCTEDLGVHYRRYKEEERAWRVLAEPERRTKWDERRAKHRNQGKELQRWWLEHMRTTTTPLAERMLLLWHNHFTTELRVVEDPLLIWEQHRLLRSEAMDNFGRLSMKVPLDPAMFRYLDSNSNVKGRPNENFAREVMELFTVGEGNYSEDDIKEAARAFTGYKINPTTGRPEKNEKLHDAYVKRVLGHRGNFDHMEILKVLLLKEQDVALNVARKMWRAFISPEPDERGVYYIAKAFYKGRYQIEPLLTAVLTSDGFWDPANRGTLIKSPIELMIGVTRQLDAKLDGRDLLGTCSRLGQEPFNPPNVKGWHGHDAWISTQSMLARQEALALAWKKRSTADDHWLAAVAKGGSAAVSLGNLLTPLPYPTDELAAGGKLDAVLSSSLYQLK